MENLQKYEKLFSRDFSLPSVEAWVRGESTNPKEWTDEKQPFLPYITTQRADDTVAFYYNLQGVSWIQDVLIKRARQDGGFIHHVEKAVLEKLTYIRPLYEKQQVLALLELQRFIKELEAGYPWFEAMWWFFQMDDASKTKGLDLESLGKVRALTDTLCNASDTVIRKSLAHIYPELGLLSSLLTTQEIDSGKVPPQKELQDRDNGYFFANNQLFIGKDRKEMEKILGITFVVTAFDTTDAVLKGNTAQKGIVRGLVRRVMGHKQIHLAQEGEILVSPMTIPDFLPAMKKAAAFVTNEGGILCHAAIVAREMKKPCIVGTKFATHILRDGDFVEVDADRGIVRLVKP